MEGCRAGRFEEWRACLPPCGALCEQWVSSSVAAELSCCPSRPVTPRLSLSSRPVLSPVLSAVQMCRVVPLRGCDTCVAGGVQIHEQVASRQCAPRRGGKRGLCLPQGALLAAASPQTARQQARRRRHGTRSGHGEYRTRSCVLALLRSALSACEDAWRLCVVRPLLTVRGVSSERLEGRCRPHGRCAWRQLLGETLHAAKRTDGMRCAGERVRVCGGKRSTARGQATGRHEALRVRPLLAHCIRHGPPRPSFVSSQHGPYSCLHCRSQLIPHSPRHLTLHCFSPLTDSGRALLVVSLHTIGQLLDTRLNPPGRVDAVTLYTQSYPPRTAALIDNALSTTTSRTEETSHGG